MKKVFLLLTLLLTFAVQMYAAPPPIFQPDEVEYVSQPNNIVSNNFVVDIAAWEVCPIDSIDGYSFVNPTCKTGFVTSCLLLYNNHWNSQSEAIVLQTEANNYMVKHTNPTSLFVAREVYNGQGDNPNWIEASTSVNFQKINQCSLVGDLWDNNKDVISIILSVVSLVFAGYWVTARNKLKMTGELFLKAWEYTDDKKLDHTEREDLKKRFLAIITKAPS